VSTTIVAAPAATAEKFARIRDFQETEVGLIGRRTEMLVTQVALAAKLHMLLYGTPGVAKSMTVDGILKHLAGLRQFKTQAYKASPPEQFLGPISLKRMAEDEFVRIVKNRAPSADICYIDEIARAPRALLPAFQGMMVEREFDAGEGAQKIPLMSLIGTCNHLPDDPELEAFFDRFTLKLTVKPPATQDQFTQILRGALRRREAGYPDIPGELVIDCPELEAFQRHVETIPVPDPVLGRFGELWANLVGAGIEPSIRRYADVTRAMQACAALDGRDEVIEDDLQIAQHALWTTPEQAEPVYKEVVRFASEWTKAKAELLESFAESLDRLGQVQSMVAGGAESTAHVTIDGTDGSITTHAVKVVNEQGKVRRLIEKHIGEATGQDVSALKAALLEIEAGKAWVEARVLGGMALR
jgi:MoxR-like ATPase